MTYKNIIISALFVLFCALAAFSQEKDFRSGAVKTAAGYLLVWNEEGNYYTVEINGKEVKQTSQSLIFFAVDSKFLQILTVPKTDFLEKSQDKLDDKTVLEKHRDWEVDYLNSAYKDRPLKVSSSWQKLDSGKDALLWQYEMPASAGSNIKKQMYLTVVKGDRLFMLNSGTTDKIDEKMVIEMLIAVVSTLKPSDKPTDLLEVQKKIRAGK